MAPGIAYLSRGRLHVKRDGEALREIESAFARESEERAIRQEQLHGWKGRSGLWGNMGMEPPEYNPWEAAVPRRTIRFAGLSRGDAANELFYVLDMGEVGGLFRYDLDSNREQRLMHRNGFHTRDLARHPESGSVAVAMPRDDGTTGISVGENDGRFLTSATVGDCIDEAPAWVPGDGRRLVYQSAGIGRDSHGYSVGLSPYRIELLNVETKSVDALAEEDDDLLQPRMLEDGTLFFVRRPYKAAGHEQRDMVSILKDVVLFPVRLAVAVFQFLNVFSVMFSGKPLTTAGGPRQRRPEDRYVQLWGHTIDAKRALERQRRDQPSALVPKEWQLVRRGPGGDESVLAENVLGYDLDADGRVVYTTGSVVSWIDDAGAHHELVRDTMIERVVALA